MQEHIIVARSWVRRLAATLALMFLACSAHAEYPDRPLKIVVAWPPGGVIDIMARFIGQQLSAELGQSVVVENRVGVYGILGTTWVAKSAPKRVTASAKLGRSPWGSVTSTGSGNVPVSSAM